MKQKSHYGTSTIFLYSDRSFAVAGPRVWNSLPIELRQSDSLGQFKRRLKTHLFGLDGTTAPSDFL